MDYFTSPERSVDSMALLYSAPQRPEAMSNLTISYQKSLVAEEPVTHLEARLAALEQVNQELRLYKQTMLEKEEFLNQGTWEWDLRSGELTFSQGIYRIFGYDDPQKIAEWDRTGNKLRQHLDEEELKKNKRDWIHILKEADTYLREMEMYTLDGKRRRLETFGKVLRNENGHAFKVLGTTRDITRLKEYEQELEVKIDELNRSNRDLEEFAYIASHDLHEPLRKLSTFGQRLASTAGDELSPVNRDYLSRMLKATENMQNLIDNLLEFSRLTRGTDNFIHTDLTMLLDDVMAEQELAIEETGAGIERSSFPELHVIPSQIKQLFNNLLMNALKFKRKDIPPIIHINCEPVRPEEKFRHKLKAHIAYYRITVSDNGIGFDPSYSEKIFQLFQRLHSKEEYPGSGIGLAICRKIADNHKGIIFAESTPGAGSRFTIILPHLTG